jgi:hypothetical protein
MSSGISRSIRRKVLDHLLKTLAWVQPTHIYVALFTTSPNSQGAGGVETTYTNYARIQHDAWNAATDADPAIATNNGQVTFPQCGVTGATIVAFGLYDDLTGGNFLGYGPCSKTITQGDISFFDTASLAVKLNETV